MYALIWSVRTVVTALLAALGLSFISALLYVWPVAQYWWRGLRAYASGLVASGFAGVWLGADLEMAVYAAGLAALGMLLGEAVLRRWSFRRCAYTLAGAAFGVTTLQSVLNWEQFQAEMAAASRSMTLQLETMQAEQGESLQAQIDSSRWLLEHFEYLYFGVQFGFVFVLCAAATAGLNRLARRHGLALEGRFTTSRPPDGLVWLAIAAALLAIADFHWPHDTLRLVSWNTGAALLTIYWLNGVACVGYFVVTLQLNLILAAALVFLFALPAGSLALALLGFLDTWLDLRQRIDRLAAMRKEAGNGGG